MTEVNVGCDCAMFMSLIIPLQTFMPLPVWKRTRISRIIMDLFENYTEFGANFKKKWT